MNKLKKSKNKSSEMQIFLRVLSTNYQINNNNNNNNKINKMMSNNNNHNHNLMINKKLINEIQHSIQRFFEFEF
jgi:hypothetical protein